MILSLSDRQRIADTYRERVGNLSLPSDATVDDVCTNLVLAIPALLETCEALERQAEEDDANIKQLIEQRDNANCRVLDLEKKLTEDPCP